jgi:hypothetical protein
MKIMRSLLTIFLIIGIAINIYFGKIHGNELLLRHLFHILAYSICMLSLHKYFMFNRPIYFLASLFPIYTHTTALFKMQYTNYWFTLFILTIILLLVGNFYVMKKVA